MNRGLTLLEVAIGCAILAAFFGLAFALVTPAARLGASERSLRDRQFRLQGGAKYHGSVEARRGIAYRDDALPANTQYFDSGNFAAPRVRMPSTSEIAASAPYHRELHAASFCATGRRSFALDARKGNLRVLGSIVNQRGRWRYDGAGYGYAKSGEYVYDESLLAAPPPIYLPVDRPQWGPRWEA